MGRQGGRETDYIHLHLEYKGQGRCDHRGKSTGKGDGASSWAESLEMGLYSVCLSAVGKRYSQMPLNTSFGERKVIFFLV